MSTRSSGNARAGAKPGPRRLTITIKARRKGHVVNPGAPRVGAGDEVTFQNAPDGTAYFVFPNPELFGKKGRLPMVVSVAKGSTKKFVVSSVKPGTYSYAVYCSAGMDFAEGGSNPRLIFGP